MTHTPTDTPSCFEAAKLVLRRLKRDTPEITRQPVGNIGEIIPDHPHTGYDQVYACDAPLDGMNEENGCIVVGILQAALAHLRQQGVASAEGIELHLAVMDEDGDDVSLRFTATDMERLDTFRDNPPAALEAAIDGLREYFLAPARWEKDSEGKSRRVMGPDSGAIMESLLSVHSIRTIESDGRAYYAGASDDSGATDFTFVVGDEELDRLRALERYGFRREVDR